MTTQDCLTYLMEAIALCFAVLMFIDFATGLLLLTAAPKATPNPVDITPIFEAFEPTEQEICQPMVVKTINAIEDIAEEPTAPIWEPLVLKTIISTDAAPTPDLSRMTRDALAEIAKAHGIQHYRPGQNRRRTKAELLAELGRLQVV